MFKFISEIDTAYVTETITIDDNDEDADDYMTDGRSCVNVKYTLIMYLLLI